MRKKKLYTSIGKDKLKRRKKRKKYVKKCGKKLYTSIGKDKLKRRKNRKKDVKNV